MARYNSRLTAGVGVVVAFLLIGGSATVAVADPGRTHSDRGSNSDRGNGNGSNSDRGNSNSNSNRRGGSDRDDDHRGGNDDSGKRSGGDGSTLESPDVRFGSGRADMADIAEAAPRLASDGGGSGSDGSGASRSGVSGSDGVGATGVSGRSGSDHGDAPNARFSPPRVTVGNGRSPGHQKGESEPRLPAPALPPEPAAPPPPPPAPAPAPTPSQVNELPAPPILTQPLGVAPTVDWSDPLWGLTGLLLIPAAGAILGYRQARAAHAAERLRRP